MLSYTGGASLVREFELITYGSQSVKLLYRQDRMPTEYTPGAFGEKASKLAVPELNVDLFVKTPRQPGARWG